jgi:hypothetical protein
VTVRILEDDDDEYENEDDFSTVESRRMLQPDPRHRSFNDQRDNPFG